VAGSCEYGDQPSGSGAMELVITYFRTRREQKLVFFPMLAMLSTPLSMQ
jgi:hypothetical protein